MRKMLLVLSFGLLFPSNIWAETIINEKSEFGKFEIIEVGNGCKMIFYHNNRKTYELFAHDYCSAEEDSFITLKPIGEVGGWKFPIKTACGEEVHLFSTPTAGGGNMCGGDTFWTAFITKESAWGSKEFGGCADIFLINLEKKDEKCIVTFFVNPGELEVERKYQATMGKLQEKIIKREKKFISQRIEKVEGIYQTAAHFTSFRPAIETSPDNYYFIDDTGKCNCEQIDEGAKVKAKLLIKRWNTGDEVICLSIVILKRSE